MTNTASLKAGAVRLLSSRGLVSMVFAFLAVNLVLAVMAHFQDAADQDDEARIGLVNEQRLLAERIPRQLLELDRLATHNGANVAALVELQRTVRRLDLGMERLLQDGGARPGSATRRAPGGASESASEPLLIKAAGAWRQLQPALSRMTERPAIAEAALPAALALSESTMPMMVDLLERLHAELLVDHDQQMDYLRQRNRLLFAVATLLLGAALVVRWRQVRPGPAGLAPARETVDPTGTRETEVGSDLLWTKNADGTYTSCNAAYARMIGRSAADIVGRTDFELTDLHSARSNRDSDLQAVASGHPLALQEWRTSAADGRKRLLEIVKTPLWDAHGGAGGVQAVARDITRRAQVEAALKETHARLQLLETGMAHAADAIVITQAEPLQLPGPRIVYVNKAFESMTGYTAAEAIGNTPRMLQRADTQSPELDRLREALAGWRPVRVELRNYTKQGRAFWVELDVVPVADATGWFTHWVAVQRDITARKQADAQKEQSFRSARDTASVMGALLERVRGSLHPSAGSPAPWNAARRPLEQVCALSEVLSGQFRIVEEPYSTAALLQHCASQGIQLAAATPPRIHTEVGAEVPATCTGDERRVQQVLGYLMQYLLHHSQTAELWLRAQCIAPDRLRIEAISRSSRLAPKDQAVLADALAHGHAAPLSCADSLEPELFAARDLTARMGGRMGSSAPTTSSHHLWMELPLHAAQSLTRPALLET